MVAASSEKGAIIPSGKTPPRIVEFPFPGIEKLSSTQRYESANSWAFRILLDAKFNWRYMDKIGPRELPIIKFSEWIRVKTYNLTT